MSIVDLTGKTYGRLVVLKRAGKVGSRATWECQCSCGNTGVWRTDVLTRGVVSSCGCFRQEVAGLVNKKHGMSETSEYHSWEAMIQRCTNPETINYQDYGGRGITVTPRWLHSFDLFLKDMGPKPGPGYSIERDDVDAGYYKDNCRWATQKEQNRNRRNTVWVSYHGRRRPLVAIAEEFKIDRSKLRRLVDKQPNATIEEILALESV